MAMARKSGPRSLARKSEMRGEATVAMSCPFAGMTRIRFKGFPRYRSGGSLSSLTGAPLGTPGNVGPRGRVSTRAARIGCAVPFAAKRGLSRVVRHELAEVEAKTLFE